jgi:hypothetical protein
MEGPRNNKVIHGCGVPKMVYVSVALWRELARDEGQGGLDVGKLDTTMPS